MVATDEKKTALFDYSNLKDCPWPDNEDGHYAKIYLEPLIKNRVGEYIDNIRTDLRVIVQGSLVLPISINSADYENSFVCSPYGNYISYAISSVDHLHIPWVKPLARPLLNSMGKILKSCQVNQSVVVNNWFFSTNLYPKMNPIQITSIVKHLKKTFPNHAIIFRSIDPCTSFNCYETLKKIGFTYIANRQIFLMDESSRKHLMESRLFHSDQKLLNASGYEIVQGEELERHEYARLIDLYRHLYIDKYSTLNPQYNEKFLDHVINNHLMTFCALKKDGHIDGVVGYIERDGKMFCPYFGYDRSIPKEAALYRLLCTVLMLEANKKNLFFHLSAGASQFKTMRKGVPCIESLAVDYSHLPYKRRLPWKLLKGLFNTLGLYFMKRY